jgi:hypothetical protein
MNAASTFRRGLNAGRGCAGCPVRPPDSAAWSNARHSSKVIRRRILRAVKQRGVATWIRRSMPGSSGFHRQPCLPVF